jgi:transposase
LERWRAAALVNGSGAGSPHWTAASRLQAVIVTAAMDEATRSGWCREQGLYPAELDAWKQDAIAGLGEPRAASAAEARQDRRRVKELERELHRKDKALAETKSSYPLKREPGGTSAGSSISSTLTRGVTLPRPRRAARLSGSFGVVPFSIPLGLISGRPFKPFSRATSSPNFAIARFCSAFSLSSFKTSCRSSAFDRPEISGTAITRLNRTVPRRGKQNINPCPVFCPCYESEECPDADRV